MARVAEIWAGIRGWKSLVDVGPDDRKVVVFSEGKAARPHLLPVLEDFLSRWPFRICWLTSERDDAQTAFATDRILPFFIGSGMVRAIVMNSLEAGVVVMTTPDLGSFDIKRSKLVGHFAYIHHSPVSMHSVYRAGAFDHFDSIFCVGPHHVEEARALIDLRGLPEKQLIEHGYGRLDAMRAIAIERRPPGNQHVLVAPTWGDDGLLETKGVEIVGAILDAGFSVIVRPHPMTVRQAPDCLAAIRAAFETHEKFRFDTNAEALESFKVADIMVSDWSGAAMEFALASRRPVVFADLPQKIHNEQYAVMHLSAIERDLREELGTVVAPDVGAIVDALRSLVFTQRDPDVFDLVYRRLFFHPGASGKAGGEALFAIARECL